MKKILLFSMLSALIIVMLASSALALEGQNGPYSYSVKKNGDLCITKFDWQAYGEQDVYIPKMIDGYTVTEIGPYAFTDKEMAEKNRYVFYTNVVVVIPDTVKQIDEKAFFCTDITALNIPASVQEIDYGAFSGCRYLSSISVDKANPYFASIDGLLYNKNKKELVAYPAGYRLTQTTIPEGIKSIAPYACFNSRGSVFILPSTLETIADYAFEYSHIKHIIPSGYTTWTDRSKYNIILPESLRSIGEYAFAHHYFDDGIPIILNMKNTNIQILPAYVFHDVKLESLDLPTTLERIEEHAFDDPLSHIRLSLPESVRFIGDYAFSKAYIHQLDFGENSSLEEISEGAFKDASLPSTISLPESLQKIGNMSFYTDQVAQSYLDTLIIPANVQDIGDDICDRLEVKVQVERGSYAEFWAIQNGYSIIDSEGDDTSWLND